jgi:hypothetical protein
MLRVRRLGLRVGLLVGLPLALLGLGAAGVGPSQARSAREITEAWRFVDDKAADVHFVGIGPENSDKLYTETGSFKGGASFAEIWNYYAEKCGTDRRYAEKTFQGVGGKSEEGEFVLLDSFVNERRTTTFALTTEEYTVSILLWVTDEERKTYLSITVAVR